jgi:hypothetical protein
LQSAEVVLKNVQAAATAAGISTEPTEEQLAIVRQGFEATAAAEQQLRAATNAADEKLQAMDEKSRGEFFVVRHTVLSSGRNVISMKLKIVISEILN